MNHDFICYIIISTIKIPYRLKNNFRYNYTVILYNNIIFRFSFQIRRSDEHTPRAVGVRKYIIFLSQIPRCGFVTQRVFVCVCISSFFSRVSIFHHANIRDEHDPRGMNRIAILFLFPFFSEVRFRAFRSFVFPRKSKPRHRRWSRGPSSRVSRFLRASHAILSIFLFLFSSLVCAESML